MNASRSPAVTPEQGYLGASLATNCGMPVYAADPGHESQLLNSVNAQHVQEVVAQFLHEVQRIEVKGRVTCMPPHLLEISEVRQYLGNLNPGGSRVWEETANGQFVISIGAQGKTHLAIYHIAIFLANHAPLSILTYTYVSGSIPKVLQ
ncbi:MAG: hypothetical protein ACP5OR_07355 [Candidatus Dormibacteria bacterium]